MSETKRWAKLAAAAILGASAGVLLYQLEKDKKRKTAMFMLIFVACVIYIITQLFSIQNLLLLSCSQMLGGIAFFFLPYPFISFETFYKVNIKKTVKICKVIGGLLMISAVVFAVLFFV